MTFDEIRIAIESRMVAWDGVPVAYDGAPNGPSVDAAIANQEPWVRLTIQHGDSFIAGLGSEPCVRRPGLIMCQVFTKDNQGSRQAYQIADSLAAHLQFWRTGHLETLASSVQRVGPSDGWYQALLRTPFRQS
ncbi:DUF4128 domain-containing protein [Halomonas sp. DP1Y21-3]|uniref:phage tail terminator-like protein n=1 Tax=Halomonas sp. DP1Y21-3 TaxID=2859080 RepID=UPI001C97528F|nr:phage tail terminator-like protein [Halomonas sp. DP1Y21-3]MBY6111218.1 DUF4128 domain-containing protein [Halomonas sp. DP1Y21-3]